MSEDIQNLSYPHEIGNNRLESNLKGCTSIFVGKDASATGYPIYVHVEDNGPEDAVHLKYYPWMKHGKGEIIKGLKVPQVPETLAFWGYVSRSRNPS